MYCPPPPGQEPGPNVPATPPPYMGLHVPSGQVNNGCKFYRLHVNFEDDMISFRIVKYMDPVVRSLRLGHILTPPTDTQD
jgi:hypothetical protein